MVKYSLFLASIFVIAAQATPEAFKKLVILHTNDMHARVLGVKPNDGMCSATEREHSSCFGGFDRIYTQVLKERAKTPGTILLDAGDQFQGTMFHQLYLGLASAGFMNTIGYDAMTVGNHEFDNGPLVLAKFIDKINFPILSANTNTFLEPALKNKIKPYVIITKNNIKIGIVGYTTEDTSFLSNPGPNITFKPIIDSLDHAIQELKKQKVDVIIALSHSGLARDIEIAKSIDGIAVIISGHSNSLLSNKALKSDGPCPLVVQSPNKNPVLLVSAYAYGKYLGRLEFSFDAQGVPRAWEGEPILLDQSIARHPAMAQEALELYKPILAFEKEKVGSSTIEISAQDCRFKECLAGNFLSDAMLLHSKKFGIDIALMNAGGIRASLPQGPINRAHLKETLPFDKKLVLFKITGSMLKQILEHGVSFAEDKRNDNTGRFLQVAGLTYTFDPRKPRGQRILEVKVYDPVVGAFKLLDSNKIYGVVTNSYLAQGGDDFQFFAQARERWSLDIELKELIESFFKSPHSQLPKLEGRIIEKPSLVSKPALSA